MIIFQNRKLNTRIKCKRLKMFLVLSKYFLELTPTQMEEMIQIANVTDKM